MNIYRPPKHNTNFLNDFKGLLSVLCVNYDCVIIDGDFNIHVDNP